MKTSNNGIQLSQKLIDWIEEDDRVSIEFDAKNDIIITTFPRDRYIFENPNLSDQDFLRALDMTKHNIVEPVSKKNIRKIILEANYFLETNIPVHDIQPQEQQLKLINTKIYRFSDYRKELLYGKEIAF